MATKEPAPMVTLPVDIEVLPLLGQGEYVNPQAAGVPQGTPPTPAIELPIKTEKVLAPPEYSTPTARAIAGAVKAAVTVVRLPDAPRAFGVHHAPKNAPWKGTEVAKLYTDPAGSVTLTFPVLRLLPTPKKRHTALPGVTAVLKVTDTEVPAPPAVGLFCTKLTAAKHDELSNSRVPRSLLTCFPP